MFRGYSTYVPGLEPYFSSQRKSADSINIKIGDTPTIGAGFWAEEWYQSSNERRTRQPENLLPPQTPSVLSGFADGLRNVLGDCIPNLSGYQELPSMQELGSEKEENVRTIRAVAMSGLSPPRL